MTPAQLDEIKQQVLETQNPVGHLRFELQNINPANYLGFGVWKLWGQGKVPVGVDTTQTEFNTVEKIGGEKTHKMTVNELVAHTHTQNSHNHTQNSHTHTLNNHTHSVKAHNHSWSGTTNTAGNHYHNFSVGGVSGKKSPMVDLGISDNRWRHTMGNNIRLSCSCSFYG